MKPELKLFDEKMGKTLSVLKGDFAAIRAGRAKAYWYYNGWQRPLGTPPGYATQNGA